MKLLFIGLSGYSYPYVRVRCYGFAAELRKYGIRTSVLSFRDHLSGGLSELEMWDRGDRAKLAMNAKAFRRLVAERPGLLYIQKIHYNAAAPYLFSRMTGTPFVLDCDDWDEGIECMFKRPWLNALCFGHSQYPAILKIIASRARACVVSSHYLLERLSGFNKRVFLIPTGVDTVMFNPEIWRGGEGKIVFGWTGVVWGEIMFENVLFMLDCFRQVATEHGDVALRIAGGGQFMPRVREVIAERYSGLDIKLEGWLPYEQMPRFLSGVDIGLLPLIQKVNPWVESKSPTKLFEYMAMGLPTVASRVGELRRIISDGKDGFLAEGRDEFIERMLLLVTDSDMRIRLGERARDTVTGKYDLSSLGKRLRDMLQTEGIVPEGR
ncbi:MAG: glycosyltransferase family 4 protein [Candidatus Aureabacteria bacterium]|nr:glycosyltransferase family 4 protein [Candidatus Auribacterota bacterium]